jgi:hypothetical protein
MEALQLPRGACEGDARWGRKDDDQNRPGDDEISSPE